MQNKSDNNSRSSNSSESFKAISVDSTQTQVLFIKTFFSRIYFFWKSFQLAFFGEYILQFRHAYIFLVCCQISHFEGKFEGWLSGGWVVAKNELNEKIAWSHHFLVFGEFHFIAVDVFGWFNFFLSIRFSAMNRFISRTSCS